ncbi:MAG: LacI family DNA-binding transcriptional regulator [Spirochaetota bacterium]
MPVRLKDIAESLHLDLSTVSRALRDDARVHADTKKTVLAEAARLGYRPNLLARRLAVGKTKTVWLILPSLGSPIEREPAEHAAALLFEHEYDLMIVQHRNDAAAYERILGRLSEGLADGALIIPGPYADPPFEEVLVHAGYPLVFIDRHPKNLGTPVDVVTTANEKAAYDLTIRCIRAGAKHVIAGFNEGNPVADARNAGCRRAGEERNVPCQFITDGIRPENSDHTAVIGSSVPFLRNTAQLLTGAIIGGVFDNWPGAAHPFKEVHVCVQDFPAMAKTAVTVILGRIAGTKDDARICEVTAKQFLTVR